MTNATVLPQRNRVTIIVTPRERWGLAKRSLESIREHTDNFELIYVDGGMPKALRSEIEGVCAQEGWHFMSGHGYLSPNQARNLGLAKAGTEYVAFVDNDVMVAPGWLEALVRDADSTGAEIVAPLTCQGEPLHQIIHQAGGQFADDPAEFFRAGHGTRRINEQMHLQSLRVDGDQAPREAFDTQLCEFHCVLVRREVFDRFGMLDQRMLATKEHLDFCMTVIQGGGRVRVAPDSLVTYVFPTRVNPVTIRDYPYFALRWSPAWQLASLEAFREKWGLNDDPYFEERRTKVQWRHVEGIVRPVVRKVPLMGENKTWQRASSKLLRGGLKLTTNLMAARHARKTLQGV